MQQPDRETQISSEVVGRLTESQKQQLSGLASQIMAGLGLDVQQKADQQTAITVVSAIFEEGLQVSGKVWVREDESVAGVFGAGREARQAAIKNVRALVQSRTYHSFFEAADIDFLDRVKTFSPDFDHLAEIEAKVLAQRGIVDNFQIELFEKSQLAPDATALRAEVARDAVFFEPMVSVEERLYSNLLVHAALYRRPGVNIEPEDLASLSQICQDEETESRVVDDVTGQMVAVAAILGLSSDQQLVENAVRNYTMGVMKAVRQVIGQELTLEALTTSDQFAIPGADLSRVAEEFVVEPEESVYLSRVEVAQARVRALQLQEIFKQFRETPASDESLAEADQTESDRQARELDDQMQNCSPLALMMLKMMLRKDDAGFDHQNSLDILPPGILFEELEMVPIQVYLGALDLVYAPQVRYLSGEGILDLEPGDDLAIVQKEIIARVLKNLSDGTIGRKEIFAVAPAPFLVSALGVLRADELSAEERQLLEDLDNSTWYRMCVLEEVEYSRFEDSFRYSGGSITLQPFLEALSQDKQEAILSQLRQVIQE